MEKNCLLINDLPGQGKVALAAMVPILSTLGHHVTSLPTALVSNTLDYGKFEILDTSDYMKKAFEVYQQLGFTFDVICTGFLINGAQVDFIHHVKKTYPEAFLVVDPIMADEGKMYNGLNEENVRHFERLATIADLLVPNFTEAMLLTKCFKGQGQLEQSQFRDFVDACRGLGCRSVVISSVEDTQGQHWVLGYNEKEKEYFEIPYQHIPVRFAGTGDIFSSCIVGKILQGKSLKEAVEFAMNSVVYMIEETMKKNAKLPIDHFKGIEVEQYLRWFYESM